MTPIAAPMPRRTAGGRGAHRGAAVLMALFIATLATLIVTGLFWNQFIVLRTIENQQLTVQSRLLLTGALDWARAILREDRNAYDALSEPWAQPLAETRLDQLGETSTLAARATIAGNIEDAQARMNLRSLAGADGKVSEPDLLALRRLCELLELPAATADLIAVAVMESRAPLPATTGETTGTITVRPLPLVYPQDLYGVRGLDPQAAAKLIPYVTVLLDSSAAVNVNTATAEVIAARVGMTLSAARALVAERDRIGYFINVDNFRNRLPKQGADLDTSRISTTTRFFVIHGQVRLDRATTRMEALVQRPGGNQAVQVLWQREL